MGGGSVHVGRVGRGSSDSCWGSIEGQGIGGRGGAGCLPHSDQGGGGHQEEGGTVTRHGAWGSQGMGLSRDEGRNTF